MNKLVRGSVLLVIMTLVLLAASPTLAQVVSNRHAKISAQGGQSKNLEGATISGNRITLKPGYIARRTSAKTIMLRKKKGSGTTIKITCSCKTAGQPGGGGNCNVRIENTDLVCYSGTCSDCDWGQITKVR